MNKILLLLVPFESVENEEWNGMFFITPCHISTLEAVEVWCLDYAQPTQIMPAIGSSNTTSPV